MSYRTVSTPRFYVNILDWLVSSKAMSIHMPPLIDGWDHSNIWRTLPVLPKPIFQKVQIAASGGLPQIEGIFNDNATIGTGCALFVLGHDLASMNPGAESPGGYLDLKGVERYGPFGDDVFNVNWDFNYNGFSLTSLNHQPYEELSFEFMSYTYDPENNMLSYLNVGSIIFASYYDLPHSPDLSLKLGWEYSGFDEQIKYGGSSTSNLMWSKPPKWGRLGPWELEKPAKYVGGEGLVYSNATSVEYYKSGRRTWDLEFSYINDNDFWGSNQMILDVLVTPEGLNSDDIEGSSFKYNLITDNNFFSQVWNKTMGGTLPFIFQPDRNNFNPDQFAICRFKKDSITVKQSGYGVYDISLIIEEVW